MPPKKRVRGPRLSPVKEDETVELPPKPAPKSRGKPKKTVAELEEQDAELDNLDNNGLVEEQGTSSTQTVTQSVKNLKKKNAEKALRDNITGSIRQAFQARSNILDIIKHSTNQLLTAYKKALKGGKGENSVNTDIFFNELDIRLSMIIDAVSVIEHRARVMKFVAQAACNLVNDSNDTSILDFLIEKLFGIWSKSVEIDHRVNIASFIGYVFESGLVRKKDKKKEGEEGAAKNQNTQEEEEEEDDSRFAVFEMEYTRKLYTFLLNFCRDKPAVRVSAIRAVSVLQNCEIPKDFEEAIDLMPREILVRSFRDQSWECRLAAIEVFQPTGDFSEDIIQLALYDKCSKVRCVALKKYGELLFRCSDDALKVELLYTCLNDHDITIRDAVKKNVIEVWINRLARAYAKNFKKPPASDDIIETDATGEPMVQETQQVKVMGYAYAALLIVYFLDFISVDSRHQVRFIMMHVLDIVRQRYNVHREPIDLFATSVLEDIVECGDIQLITRATINDMYEAISTLRTQSVEIFFWRVFIEYCVERAQDSNDAMFAVERFAPKMVKMCNTVRGVLASFKTMELTGKDKDGSDIVDWDLAHIQQSNILQNILITFRHFDKEQSGKVAWKSLLEDILYNINNTKSVVDIIVQDLAQYFYAENPVGLLSDVASSISDMLHRVTTGDQTMRDETVFIGSAQPKFVSQEDREVLSAITDYELLIFNAILKTGVFKEIVTILTSKYRSLAVPKLTSSVMDERIVAMECVGLIGMIDLETVKNELELCREIAENDLFIQVKSCYYTMIVDLCVSHGTDVIDGIMGRAAGGGGNGGQLKGNRRKSNSKDVNNKGIVASMCDVVLTENPEIKNSEVVLKCCEGLCKILLHEKIEPDDKTWQMALITLLSRLNYKLDGVFSAKIRSIITAMLKFFASLYINNQKCLVNCFKQFFTEWDHNQTLIENAGAHEFIYQRLCRCATLFGILTRHSILMPDKQVETPCHETLLEDALKELSINENSCAANFYCEVMPLIELDSFRRDSLARFYDDVNELIEVYMEDDPKNRLSEFRKFRKRLMKVLGISDRPANNAANNNAQENVASSSNSAMQPEIEVKLEPLDEMEVPASVSKSSRTNSRNTVRASSSKSTNVAQEIRELMDSPPRELTATKKKTTRTASSSEPRPKRAAARRLQITPSD